MNAETIRDWIRRQPFEPFEVHMTNGEKHFIRHPEVALLVGNRLVVGYPETGRIAILLLLHAATIEWVQAA
jgi:hypothetical protein